MSEQHGNMAAEKITIANATITIRFAFFSDMLHLAE
jgi:hypothetical protein